VQSEGQPFHKALKRAPKSFIFWSRRSDLNRTGGSIGSYRPSKGGHLGRQQLACSCQSYRQPLLHRLQHCRRSLRVHATAPQCNLPCNAGEAANREVGESWIQIVNLAASKFLGFEPVDVAQAPQREDLAGSSITSKPTFRTRSATACYGYDKTSRVFVNATREDLQGSAELGRGKHLRTES